MENKLSNIRSFIILRSRPSDKGVVGGGGGRGGYPDPEIRGRGRFPETFSRPFGPQFGLKIRGTGPPALDPPRVASSLQVTVLTFLVKNSKMKFSGESLF